MRFVFPRSHAYPKGRVIFDENGTTGPECWVEFGDGIAVLAVWTLYRDGLKLAIPEYRTERGTLVTARTWLIRRDKRGQRRSESIDRYTPARTEVLSGRDGDPPLQ